MSFNIQWVRRDALEYIKERKMIKLWGRPDSTNVRKVIWCLNELDLSFEHILIGGRYGLNHQAGYLNLNPNGLIPCLEDDGLVLWESNTILRFLAEKYGQSTLYIQNIEQRYAAEKWMDWCLSVLASNFRNIMLQLKLTPEQRDFDVLNSAIQSFAEKLNILNTHLKSNQFIANAQFSVVDISLASYVYSWKKLNIENAPPYVEIERWFDQLKNRNAFINTIQQEHSSIKS